MSIDSHKRKVLCDFPNLGGVGGRQTWLLLLQPLLSLWTGFSSLDRMRSHHVFALLFRTWIFLSFSPRTSRRDREPRRRWPADIPIRHTLAAAIPIFSLSFSLSELRGGEVRILWHFFPYFLLLFFRQFSKVNSFFSLVARCKAHNICSGSSVERDAAFFSLSIHLFLCKREHMLLLLGCCNILSALAATAPSCPSFCPVFQR